MLLDVRESDEYLQGPEAWTPVATGSRAGPDANLVCLAIGRLMTLTSPPFDPTRAEVRQARVAQRLSRAIGERGLQVVYQPEVDLTAQKLVSLEALCRWHDDELDRVTPDEFIAVAEARGLIAPLGHEILRMVLADLPALLARWPQARVAINVSGLELAQPDFAAQFLATLKQHSSAYTRHLELEITESIFHSDPRVVCQNMLALQSSGITLAIDDFGTGQSSLSRLHTLPFDKIKMDKSFAQGLANDTGRAIMKAMVDLCGTLDKSLVAEGIETPAQQQTLIGLGCKQGQGYLFSPPKALSELLASFTLPGL